MTGFLQAFFEGFTGGTLFSWAELPGAPTQVFADDNSNYPQRELMASLLRQQEEEEIRGREQASSGFYADVFESPFTSHQTAGRVVGNAPTQIRAIQLARDLRIEFGDEEALRLLHRTIKEMKHEPHGA